MPIPFPTPPHARPAGPTILDVNLTATFTCACSPSRVLCIRDTQQEVACPTCRSRYHLKLAHLEDGQLRAGLALREPVILPATTLPPA